jgi:hypothetical protein
VLVYIPTEITDRNEFVFATGKASEAFGIMGKIEGFVAPKAYIEGAQCPHLLCNNVAVSVYECA